MAKTRTAKVIALSISQSLSRVIGLLVTMVMARILVKEDVAAYRQTLLAYAMVVPILNLGISEGMYYFLPNEKKRVRGRVLDGITVLVLTGLCFSIFLALGGNEILAQRFSNPKVAQMLLWMIPFAIITTPSNLANSVLVARDQVKIAAIFGTLRQFLIGVATVIPLILWQTAEATLIGNVVASIFMAAAAIGLMWYSTPNDSNTPSYAGIRQLVGFTLPLAAAGMMAGLSMQMDKLIVALMRPPGEFAVYALGAIQLPLVGILAGSITAVILAEMRKSVAEGNTSSAVELFRRSAHKSSLVMLPMMVFFMITADSFITIIYTTEYSESATPFRWYLALLPIRTVYFGSLMIALGKNRYALMTQAIALIVNVLVTILMVRAVGAWGAAAATVATAYLWTIPASLFLLAGATGSKWLEIIPVVEYLKTLLFLLPATLASVLLVRLIENPYLEFAAVAFLFAVFLAWYWNGRIYTIANLKKQVQKSINKSQSDA